MTAAEAVARLALRLTAAGLAQPALDAQLLVRAVAGLTREAMIAVPDTQLDISAVERLAGFAARRAAGEPVSRILGRREFYGRDFIVSPAVLDPRPETELLVETGLALLAGQPSPRIVDLGTGSGAALLTMLAERSDAIGIGLDISAEALVIARANAVAMGVTDRSRFCQASWLAALGPGADLIIANPPYIPAHELPGLPREVRLHDPALALNGGPDGLESYRAICAGLAAARSAAVAFEVGAGQASAVAALLAAAGYQAPVSHADLAGIGRVVAARRFA